MNAFERAQFPELVEMRRRARRRELMTNLAVAGALLLTVMLLVAAVSALETVLEWAKSRLVPQLPTVRPAFDSALLAMRALLG